MTIEPTSPFANISAQEIEADIETMTSFRDKATMRGDCIGAIAKLDRMIVRAEQILLAKLEQAYGDGK